MSAHYKNIDPITERIVAERQRAKRHYGVHPYFTRRPYNVVRDYILHYTKPGDLVLDPFGGSGVTAIEAFLAGRVGIHSDINPLANFIASTVASFNGYSVREIFSELEALKLKCSPLLQKISNLSPSEIKQETARFRLPQNVRLPENSDVEFLFDLFAPEQLLALASIWNGIHDIRSSKLKRFFLLGFSAAVSKLNKTFLSAEGRAASRGGSSLFSIYRYKVAKIPVELPLWPTFEERILNLVTAKKEIDSVLDASTSAYNKIGEFHSYSCDIFALAKKLGEKVDYIFTDPPYGGHISYLDLSTMWNAWLETMPDVATKGREIIVGGDLKHSDEFYKSKLALSIAECLKMLRHDRWFSVVFQHWQVDYFEAILRAAEEGGAELRAAITQIGDTVWSMHKKKGKESVLAGELILTFYKPRKLSSPAKRSHKSGRFDFGEELKVLLADGADRPLFGEAILNHLVLSAWRQGSIDSLKISKAEIFDEMVRQGWSYDSEKHFWTAKQNQKLLA